MIERYQRALIAASIGLVCTAAAAGAHSADPQEPPRRAAASAAGAPAAPPPVAATTPADYVVGPEDVLSVVFWREKDISADVVVRPDGKISLPLLNDVEVAGLTPEQIRARVTEAARQFIEEPNASVVVKQINSRKVYITGNVERPGTFPLLRSTSILQLIALAGGLKEFAKAGDIVLVRSEGARQLSYSFNYDDLKNRKKLAQNILLQPGDTVIVP